MTEIIDNTVERWLPVPGFQGIYEVSDYGRVRNILKRQGTYAGCILSPGITKGRHKVNLCHPESGIRQWFVHILVAMAFIGPVPVGKEVNHIDFNPANNRLDNLEYLTKKENSRHSHANIMATRVRGEKHPCAKFREDQIIKMRALYADGMGPTKIAQYFSMSRNTVKLIVFRKSWKHIP